MALAAMGPCGSALAQEAEPGPPPASITSGPPAAGGDQELAQKLSNPVASLISVPLQENVDLGAGPRGDGIKSTLNVQPVIPFTLNADWKVIVRTILPVIAQEDISAPGESEFGLGDTTQSLFFSPQKQGPGGITWGVGPAILYPTATDSVLGGGKWGAGPTALVLKQSHQNTFGLLANHIWSFAGKDTRGGISTTFIQPFFSHSTPKATTFSLNTETSYDWKHKNWVVPVNVSVAQLTKVGKQRIQIGVGARYYVEKPEGGPDWGVRAVLTFLFPE
ncbi:MAG TPA: hypothetical protein VMQ93_06650 [Novosphingobium sp.]|nr:hypothetical protein [Novosphingobium sp.]